MKIAVVTPRVHKQGGTEKQTLFLVEHLSARHEVHLFTAQAADLSRPEVRLHRIPVFPYPPLLRYLSFLLFNTALRAWRRLFLGERFDLTFSTSGDVLGAEVIAAHFCQARRWREMRRGIGRPLSSTPRLWLRKMHIYLSTWIPWQVEKIAYRARRLQAIVCVSRGTAEDLAVHYAPAAPRRVVFNCVDGETFNPQRRERERATQRRAFGLAEGDRVFLFIGGDWERKGVPQLLRAFLEAGFPRSVRLWIVGNGERAAYQLRFHLSGGEGVTFFPPSAEVWRYYAAADYFFFPSLYDPCPLAPLEAMACGLPTAVSRHCGTSELIGPEQEALRIEDPDDTAALIRLMRQMQAQEAAMAAMGRRGAQRVSGLTRQATNEAISRCLEGLAGR